MVAVDLDRRSRVEAEATAAPPVEPDASKRSAETTFRRGDSELAARQ
jgi:hypothetical protein